MPENTATVRDLWMFANRVAAEVATAHRLTILRLFTPTGIDEKRARWEVWRRLRTEVVQHPERGFCWRSDVPEAELSRCVEPSFPAMGVIFDVNHVTIIQALRVMAKEQSVPARVVED